jgi:hypothetical protein
MNVGVLSRRLSLMLGFGAMAGCAPAPLLQPDLAAPPAILVPANVTGVVDSRARFREILCAVTPSGSGRDCQAMLHRLGGEAQPSGRPVGRGAPRLPLRLAIVPGYGADCFAGLVTILGDARAHLDAIGWPSIEVPVEGLSSSTRNAELIRDHLLAEPLARGERLVLIGYSKGTADMLEALARYPEIRPRVAAAVSLAGTVAGSPLADDPPRLLPWLARSAPGSGCDAGDGGAFESLRRSTRLAALASHPPSSLGVPLFSLGSFTSRQDTSSVLVPMHDRLSVMDPRNDSQTLFTDQLIPGSVLLGYLNADHWAVGLPLDQARPLLAALFTDRNAFPRPAMMEAVMRIVEETLLERRQ